MSPQTLCGGVCGRKKAIREIYQAALFRPAWRRYLPFVDVRLDQFRLNAGAVHGGQRVCGGCVSLPCKWSRKQLRDTVPHTSAPIRPLHGCPQAFACSSRKRQPTSTAGTAQAHAAPGCSAAAALTFTADAAALQLEPEPRLATRSGTNNNGAATPLRHSSRSRDPPTTSSTPSRKRKGSSVACPVPPSCPPAESTPDQRSGSHRWYNRRTICTADQATPSNFREQNQDKSESPDNPGGGSNGGDGGGADAVPVEGTEKLGGVPEKLGDSQPLRLIIIGHNPSEASWKAGHA